MELEIASEEASHDSSNIFALLIDFNKQKIKSTSKLNKLETWSLIGAAVLFLFAAIMAIFVHKLTHFEKVMALYLLLASQILAYISQLSMGINGLISLFTKKSVSIYLQYLEEKMKQEDELINKLRLFPLSKLKYCKNRFTFEVESLLGRINSFAGVVNKLGFIPVFLTFATSFYTLYQDIGNNQHIIQNIFFYITAAIVGMYLGCTTIMRVTNQFRLFVYMFNEAIKRKNN